MKTQNLDFDNERAALRALRSNVVHSVALRSGVPSVLFSMWTALDHLLRFIEYRASIGDSALTEYLPELDAKYVSARQLIWSMDLLRICADKRYGHSKTALVRRASKNSANLRYVAGLMRNYVQRERQLQFDQGWLKEDGWLKVEG